MASSDDEGEEMIRDVSEYHFVDEKDEPVSIAELPIVWGDDDASGRELREIFLRGYTDDRRLSVYRQVKAWKFDISQQKPQISVLSSQKEWIKLLQPRKPYLEIIRTIIITVHFLHLLKVKPDITSKALWDKLSKTFSFEGQPCENDLVDHIALIRETVKRDQSLKNSNPQVLITFLENPRKKRTLDEDVGTSKKSSFIVDDNVVDVTDMNDENQEESDDDEEDDGFDYVCALCDNGGDILCCEGRCLRSFHATTEAGHDSQCDSLGLSDEKVKRLPIFLCNNCQHNQHQCYACGKLGSSDKSAKAEVFRCVIATCGHFYHPHCVARLLSPRNDLTAKELREKISTGEQFACPIHECYVCKEGENKNEKDLQFAVCRRCPKSYHRKCLPRDIAFDGDEDETLIARAWEGLLPNGRILIYCLDHEIDEDLCTPLRNHIKFPFLDLKKKRVSSISSGCQTVLASEDASKKNRLLKKPKLVEKSSKFEKLGDTSIKTERRPCFQSSTGQRKGVDTAVKTLKKSTTKFRKPLPPEGGPSLGDMLYLISQNLDPDDPVHTGDLEKTQLDEFALAESDSSMDLDAEAKERILSIIEDTASSVTIEEIEKNCKIPGRSVYSSKTMDKSITRGRVEACIEAISAAQHKIDNGGSVENAKLICDPRLPNQIMRWKEKLKVYLAPFLYGLRYTSFGRHFTSVDKLNAVVDRLHWYVQDGDTIVDFCCGSNDFSLILKQKLDEMGKRKCSFKNFDILPPKNDFSFEKRDWMTVSPNDLPSRSNLIMGLNPPFGVNAHLANKFINKALQFKPKILILIVPRETERLDGQHRDFPYDLVWEDGELLSGKSFYLPGSIDVNGKQMEDWNVIAPPLYLWSHPDWTSRHKSIAEQKGHLKNMPEKAEFNENHKDKTELNPHTEVLGKSSLVADQSLLNEPEQFFEQRASETGKGKSTGTENVQKYGSNQSWVHSREIEQENISEEKQGKESSSGKWSDSHHSDNSSKRLKASSNKELSREKSSNQEHSSVSESHTQRRARYGSDKEADRRSNSKGTEHPVQRSNGNKKNKKRRKGYARNEDPMTGGGSWERNPRGDMNNNDPAMGVNNWARTSSPDVRSQHEHYLAQQREITDIMGYQPYSRVSEPYRMNNMPTQVPFFGPPDPGYANQRTSHHLGGSRPDYVPPYSQLAPPANFSHNYPSTMQRYAPRLDELNHTRMNEPRIVDRNGMYDPRHGHPVAQPPPDSFGFAPSPYSSFSTHGSSGWLNE